MAGISMAAISAIYAQVVIQNSIPAASSLFGHLLGVVGFIFMLLTEVLYSLRKRSQIARWGKLQNWLSFHIYTGIVGPFLVLLHTSWKFNGLAGVLTLLTVIIVLSGFIGRYFYTAIPRSADGTVLESDQVTRQIDLTLGSIQEWQSNYPGLLDLVSKLSYPLNSTRGQISPNKEPWRDIIKSAGKDKEVILELIKLLNKQTSLNQQLHSLAQSRRLLAIWHTLHVPLGVSLFILALVHVAATLYYATLLH